MKCDECGSIFEPMTDAYKCPVCGSENQIEPLTPEEVEAAQAACIKPDDYGEPNE